MSNPKIKNNLQSKNIPKHISIHISLINIINNHILYTIKYHCTLVDTYIYTIRLHNRHTTSSKLNKIY